MTHKIRWNAEGWHVETMIGTILVASVVLDTYCEALVAYVTLTDGH